MTCRQWTYSMLVVLRLCHVPSSAGPSSAHPHLSSSPILWASPISPSCLLHERSLEAVPKAVAPYFWIDLINAVVYSFFALHSHVLQRPPRLRPRPSTSACVFGSRCAYGIFLFWRGRASPGPDGLHASSHLFCTRSRYILPCCAKLHRVRRQLHK
ncbi:hypothetical protein C8F01DRAFT_1126978 [Mycena amicta]|nr:hypothetical protein C8F01DRAFT_1126978 [Mycena amicta]